MARKKKQPPPGEKQIRTDMQWKLSNAARDEARRLRDMAKNSIALGRYQDAQKIINRLESNTYDYVGGKMFGLDLREGMKQLAEEQATRVVKLAGAPRVGRPNVVNRILSSRGMQAAQVDTLKLKDDIVSGLLDKDNPSTPLQVVERHADDFLKVKQAATAEARAASLVERGGKSLFGAPMTVSMGELTGALERGGIPAMEKAAQSQARAWGMKRSRGKAGAVLGGLGLLALVGRAMFGDQTRNVAPPMSPEMQMLMMKQMSTMKKDESLIESRKMSDMLKWVSMLKMIKEMQQTQMGSGAMRIV